MSVQSGAADTTGIFASMWSWFSSATLAEWGALASISGLVLTGAVFLGVRRLRAYYVVRKRLPELRKRLIQHSHEISRSLNDFEAFKYQLAEELAQAKATLQSIKKKMTGAEKKEVKKLLGQLKNIDLKNPKEAPVRDCYLGLLHVQEQLKNLEADLAWER